MTNANNRTETNALLVATGSASARRTGSDSADKERATPAGRSTVSVVIVCYNQSQFLGEAIASCLSQSYRFDEILVVDDGSTDETASVAQSFPEVHYIRQTNQGLSAARNRGISDSTGDYICFLDADDRFLPDAVSAAMACFARHPESAFVYGTYRDIDRRGVPMSDARFFRVGDGQHFKALLERMNFIAMHATVMYRRHVLESVGAFEPALPRCEDYDLFLRITKRYPVNGHRALVAEYRRHDRNMSLDRLSMMKTALLVVRRQRRGLTPELTKSAGQGARQLRNYYGGLLVNEWVAERKTKGTHLSTMWRFVTIACRCPAQALPLLKGKCMKLLNGNRTSFGNLRRVSPFSRQFGFDRGLPVDRYYIENFLMRESASIAGVVMEIGDNSYTRRFGGDKVTRSEVLDINVHNLACTIVADLSNAPHIPSNTFDCIILTQTLHFIYDLRAAMSTIYRILKPGGCLLLTTPGISQIFRDQTGVECDSWRFTASSVRRLVSEVFGAGDVQVESWGNVLAATAFLYGLPTSELTTEELDYPDSDYQLILSAKYTKCS